MMGGVPLVLFGASMLFLGLVLDVWLGYLGAYLGGCR